MRSRRWAWAPNKPVVTPDNTEAKRAKNRRYEIQVRALTSLPDIESLRCFEAAAVALNFRRAARSVALSPAALSDRIRRLEEQVGEPLFHRTTRRVSLTVTGERLLPRVRKLLDEARRCLQPREGAVPPVRADGGDPVRAGAVLVDAGAGGAAQGAARADAEPVFRGQRRPAQPGPPGGAGLRGLQRPAVEPGLGYELLHREDYALVASASLLHKRPLKRAADAQQHTLIDVQPDLPLFRYFLDARPAGESWAFAASEFVGTIAAVRYRVLEGAGVAVLPRYFVGGTCASAA